MTVGLAWGWIDCDPGLGIDRRRSSLGSRAAILAVGSMDRGSGLRIG